MFVLLCLFIYYFLGNFVQKLGTVPPALAVPDYSGLSELFGRHSFSVVADSHWPFPFVDSIRR